MKTFHSTQLLRHLFTVHAFLGEYELALKAFDSYVEIMTKGRARAAKAGDLTSDIDNDNIALRHISTVILVCCRYGSQKGSEKAFRYGIMAQQWLDQIDSKTTNETLSDGSLPAQPEDAVPRPSGLHKDSLAVAWRAIAISQATWAYYTFNTALRSDLYDKAVLNLRRSLEHYESVGTLYALARVLAQKRDIAHALEVVKRALKLTQHPRTRHHLSHNVQSEHDHLYDDLEAPLTDVDVLPLYHLLALLLSSREDLDLAVGSCDAGLSGVEDLLAGQSVTGEASRELTDRDKTLEILTNGHDASASGNAAVQELHIFAKQNILEAKMTRMALLDMMEGPEIAVNTSNELLELYTRLFGKVDLSVALQKRQGAVDPAKSKAGTVRSMKPKPVTNRLSKTHSYHGSPSVNYSRPTTANVTARTSIDNDVVPHGEEHDAYASVDPEKNNASRSTSVRKKIFSHRHKKSDGTTAEPLPTQLNTTGSLHPPSSIVNTARTSMDRPTTATTQHTAPDLAAPEHIPHNLSNSNLPAPVGHTAVQPSPQDTRLIVPPPGTTSVVNLPRPNQLQSRRFELSHLAKIWNFITGLYIDADLLADAKEASEEARRLVEALEADLAEQDSSVQHFQDPGWSGCPSLEDLWAEVYLKVTHPDPTQPLTHPLTPVPARPPLPSPQLPPRRPLELRTSPRAPARPRRRNRPPLHNPPRHVRPRHSPRALRPQPFRRPPPRAPAPRRLRPGPIAPGTLPHRGARPRLRPAGHADASGPCVGSLGRLAGACARLRGGRAGGEGQAGALVDCGA